MGRLPRHRPPTTPGEFLREMLEELGVSQSELARRTQMPFQRVNDIVNGRRAVTAASALRLAAVLGVSPGFWLNAQQAVDLYEAEKAEAQVLAGLEAIGR